LHRKASLWGAFFALWLSLPPLVAADESAVVARVVDGDSLLLADGRKVRLVGINAPELGSGERPDQPLARAALAALRNFLGSDRVRLRFGRDRYDHYGRILAYVDNAAGASAGEHLLRQGLAMMVAIPPNLDHVAGYRRLEVEARGAKRGVWAERAYRPVPAKQLGTGDTGFRFVTGTVARVGESRKYIYLDLTDNFAIAISRDNWHHFGDDPKKWTGKRVQVRGWISLWRDKLRVRIGHPAMVETLK
jgi:micrococcal nuclease